MKKLWLLLFAMLSFGVLADETNTIFHIGFEADEGYPVGNIVGTNNWQKSWWGAGGNLVVVENPAQAQAGSRYLNCDNINHQTSFDLSSLCPANAKLQLTGYALLEDGASSAFYVKLHALGTSGSDYNVEITEFILSPGGGASLAYSDSSGSGKSFSVSGLEEGVYHRFSLIISPATRSIERMSIDDQVSETEGMYYKSAQTEGCGTLIDGVRVMNSGRFDSFTVETCPLPPTKEFVITPAKPNFGRENTKISLTIANQTSGSFNYNVIIDGSPEWIAANPTSGTCEGAATVELTVDRAIMTNGYYRAMVTVDGGEWGTKSVPVCCPNGTVIYYENFDSPYMQIGSIEGQDSWRDYNQLENNLMLVTNSVLGSEGNCAYVVRSGGYEGYACNVYSTEGSILNVSFSLYKGSAAPEEADVVYLMNDYWNRSFSLMLWRYQNALYVYRFGNDGSYNVIGQAELPLDQWIDFSMTLDYRKYAMTKFSAGEYSTNYVNGIPLSYKIGTEDQQIKRFTTFCVACGYEADNAMLLLDNLRFEEQERPDTCDPVIDGDFTFGEDLIEAKGTIVNLGSKPFDYTLEMLNYTDNFTITPNSGTVSESADVTFKFKRTGLQDGFHRAKAKLSYHPSGEEGEDDELIKLLTFAQGGYYYQADFTGSDFTPGDLNSQDTWKAVGNGTAPQIVVYNDAGDQALYFATAGQATTPVRGPAETQLTFNFRFLMENNANTTYARIGQNGSTGYLPIVLRRDKMTQEVIVGYVPTGEETLQEWFRTSLGEWHDFSFTIDNDVAIASALSASLDGEEITFEEGVVPLDPTFDEKPLSALSIATVNDGPDEQYDTGFFMANISATDAGVPEPAILALAALLLAFAAKRRA